MQILEELNNLIEEANGFESLNEKIMTKKQAKQKRKLRAKRRAEKKAEKREQEKIEQSNIDNTEEDTNNQEENDEDYKQLIVYKEAEKQDYTKEFLDFVKKIIQLTDLFNQNIKNAVDEWKSLGEDEPITEAIHQKMVAAIDSYSEEIAKLYDNHLPTIEDKMHLVELEFVNAQLQVINKYIEKQGKYIYSLKPNESLEAPDTSTDKRLKDKQTLDDKKRNKVQLIPYKGFIKEFLNLHDKFRKAINDLNNLPTFAEMINEVNAFISGTTCTLLKTAQDILNIPVVDGFIKALMYSNPWTAAVYDGKFGKFNLTGHLNKINDKLQQRRKKEGGKPTYDSKGIITSESLDSMNKRSLQIEYECNKTFAALVNLCYNHTEVDKNDKAYLLNYTQKLNKLFSNQNSSRDEIVKIFQQLLEVINKICNYMKWKEKNAIIKLIDNYRFNKGTTEKEQSEIENKASKVSDKYQELKNKINNYWTTKDENGEYKYTKEQIKDIMMDAPERYKEQDIDSILNSLKTDQQESYSFANHLIKLIEKAEA